MPKMINFSCYELRCYILVNLQSIYPTLVPDLESFEIFCFVFQQSNQTTRYLMININYFPRFCFIIPFMTTLSRFCLQLIFTFFLAKVFEKGKLLTFITEQGQISKLSIQKMYFTLKS